MTTAHTEPRFLPAQARRLVHQFEVDISKRPGALQVNCLCRLAENVGFLWATPQQLQAALIEVLK